MWYESTNNGKFVNRDLHTSLNVRRCLALSVRVLELCCIATQGRPQSTSVGENK